MLAQKAVADDTGRDRPRFLWRRGFGRATVSFGLEMRGLYRWVGVSDEDGFVRRMEAVNALDGMGIAWTGQRTRGGVRVPLCGLAAFRERQA
jgi:hypothetical protein